jgi:uncharacterized protein (DUF1697 family)
VQFVVLLRGVNAGPNNRISMGELRAALEEAGFADVRTLLQSGNVVLAHEGGAQDVEARVRQVLTSRFALDVDVVVRDEDALRAVVADNPLDGVATDGSRQFVVFCSEPHDRACLPDVVAPEQLACRPMELHAWCPDGVRGGKLMTALGRRPPAPVTTFRNWNTVVKLAAMLDG